MYNIPEQNMIQTLHPTFIFPVLPFHNYTDGHQGIGDGFFRVYNSFNQISKVYNGSDANGILLREFVYHPVEERVLIKKTYNLSGNWKETVIYVDKNFVRVKNESGTFDTTYVFHEGALIAERKSDDTTKVFYHPDNIGSTSLITDSSGNLLEKTFYEPYGTITSGGTQSRYDYEAKEFDSVTQDYDFHFRRQGIAGTPPFQQPDTLLPNVYDPQQLNRYAFERNNPWKNTDESGHLVWYIAIPLAIVIGIALEYISIKIEESFSKNKKPINQKQQAIQEGIYGGATEVVEQTTASSFGEGIGKGAGIITDIIMGADFVGDRYGGDTCTYYEKCNNEDKESNTVLIKKFITYEDSNMQTWVVEEVAIDDLEEVKHSLVSDGWTPVLDDDGNVDYYCIGTGCPE